MQYRVFYTDVKLPSGQSQPTGNLLPYARDTKEQAIELAFKLLDLLEQNPNIVVWKIDGPNEFLLTRDDIEREYHSKTGKWPRTQRL